MNYLPHKSGLATAILAATALLASTISADAQAQNSPYVQAEGGASFLGEWSVGELGPGTAAYGMSAGYRWSTFGVGMLVEHNMWFVNSIRDEGEFPFPDSVLNIGLEGGFTYYDDYLRTGLAAGTSTLLINTEVVDAGHTGIFLEAQPVAIRLPLGAGWTTEIEPLNFIVMAPVLDSIPLFELAYRTKLGFERSF